MPSTPAPALRPFPPPSLAVVQVYDVVPFFFQCNAISVEDLAALGRPFGVVAETPASSSLSSASSSASAARWAAERYPSGSASSSSSSSSPSGSDARTEELRSYYPAMVEAMTSEDRPANSALARAQAAALMIAEMFNRDETASDRPRILLSQVRVRRGGRGNFLLFFISFV